MTITDVKVPKENTEMEDIEGKSPFEKGRDMIGTTIFTPNMMTTDTTATTEIPNIDKEEVITMIPILDEQNL